MPDKKRFLGLVVLGYLLGALTAFLALRGLDLFAGGGGGGALGATAGLLVMAALLGLALWRTGGRSEESEGSSARRPPTGRPSAAVPSPGGGRPAFRRAIDDLPTVTDYYQNAADGVLPAPSPSYRDLDPASDPAYAPGGVASSAASGA